jgi:hypothetical protein
LYALTWLWDLVPEIPFSNQLLLKEIYQEILGSKDILKMMH